MKLPTRNKTRGRLALHGRRLRPKRLYAGRLVSRRRPCGARRRIRLRAFFPALLLALAVIGFLVFRAVFGGEESMTGAAENATRAPVFETHIGGVPLYRHFLETGTRGRPGTLRDVQWIVIHETANTSPTASAFAHNSYLHKEAVLTPLSWHYTVDDRAIVHHLPDNEVGFHAGDRNTPGGGNTNGIGIELCVNDGSDFEVTKQNAAKLAAFLIDGYDLTIDSVKRHADFADKNCPARLIESGEWEAFCDSVEQELEALRAAADVA